MMKETMRILVVLAAVIGLLNGCSNPTLSGSVTGEDELTNGRAITTSQQNTHDGYFYSFWTNGGGNVSMNLGAKGNYSVDWSNCGNFTAGKGWAKGSARTINYNAGVWQPSGNCTLAVYGWTTAPLVEYYIIDSWGSYDPRQNGLTYVTSVYSDNAWYDVYKHQQIDQPSILSNKSTFWQYISIRQSKRPTGSNVAVTTATHFNKWKEKGLKLGTHNYQILLTEGYQSSGHSNVTVW